MTVDPDSPQVLASLLMEHEAAILASHLESLGTRAHVWGANSSAAWPEVPSNVQVVVRQADLTRARQAIGELRRQVPEGH